MILKYKDSRNNWVYVQLGNFIVNKLSISLEINRESNKYTIEELYKGKALENALSIIKNNMNNLGLDFNNPHIDENVVHKLNNVVVVNNEVYNTKFSETGYDGMFSSKSYELNKVRDIVTYIISDECYLMNDEGKTIEKLM